MKNMSRNDIDIIGKIAKRAERLLAWDRFTVIMDVSTIHEDVCPLNLEGLLNADDINFAHDIMGINRNLDRITPKLLNDFLPRYSA